LQSREAGGNSARTPLGSRIVLAAQRLRRPFTTQKNIFGLSRQYFAEELPTHDPEDSVPLQDLSDMLPTPTDPPNSATRTIYPYPNSSTLQLGEWYWNGGVQKSQASFKELVKIVGDPDFRPADVRDAKWDHIDKQLASDSDEGEWLDADWTRTPVTIQVPFQRRRGIPLGPQVGPRNYIITDFYHRSLVSVVREKLADPHHDHLFHYEPYELKWQPGGAPRPVRVYGELYSSPAFMDAHQELQESPGEPDCDLPRFIIGLMFWSDATHLTSFGDAKLHPLYMYFGNESKYRRCKPSCHLCNHVAYFQKVRSDITSGLPADERCIIAS
jgi:hypothetical protein